MPLEVGPGRLGVFEVLYLAARLYRHHVLTFIVMVAPVVVPVQLLAAVVLTVFPDRSEAFIVPPSRFRFTRPEVVVDTSTLGLLAVGSVLAVGLTLVAFQFATAASLKAVTVAYAGCPASSWWASFRWGLRRFRPLVRLTALWIALVALGWALGVLPGVWLYASWAVAVPVLLLEEERGPGAVLRRSLRLVRGRWWAVFAVLALSRIVVSVPSLLIRSLPEALDGGFVLHAAAAATAEVLVTPFLVATVVILYSDLRARKEDLDPADFALEEPPTDEAAEPSNG